MLYLDCNSNYPLLDEVKARLLENINNDFYLGNASSIHQKGRQLKQIYLEAQKTVADYFELIQDDYHIVFFSSVTEIYNHLAHEARESNTEIFCGNSEHKALKNLVKRFYPNNVLASNQQGFVENINPSDHSIYFLSHSNGELGTINNSINYPKNTVLDLCQSILKSSRHNHNEFLKNVDAFTFAGHKIGAMQGVACLVIKKTALIDSWSLMNGAEQQKNFASGSLNIMAIDSLNVALKVLSQGEELRKSKLLSFKNKIIQFCRANKIEMGPHEEDTSLWNTICILPQKMRNDLTVAWWDRNGIALSSGSACRSQSVQPSDVYLDYGWTQEQALSVIRLSWSHKVGDDAWLLLKASLEKSTS